MLALWWKDRKDVFILSTINAPTEVPCWVDIGTAPDADPDTKTKDINKRIRTMYRGKLIIIYTYLIH